MPRRGAVRCLPAGSAWLTVSRPPVGFVDREGAASEVRPVESCNSRSGCTALRHVHKPKAARVACLAVGHHIDRVYSTIRLEELTEVLIGRGARQVANKNVHTKVLLGAVLSRSPEYSNSTQEQYRGLESGEFCKQTNCMPIPDCRISPQSRYGVPQTEESTVLSGAAVCACAQVSTSRGAGASGGRAG